jgi:hypothetical protein
MYVCLDVITLQAGQGLFLNSTGISWPTDVDKFKQPPKFQSWVISQNEYKNKNCTSSPCAPTSSVPAGCTCGFWKGTDENAMNTSAIVYYRYFYPDSEKIQYLHDSYPNQISPIKGVTDEHFKVKI